MGLLFTCIDSAESDARLNSSSLRYSRYYRHEKQGDRWGYCEFRNRPMKHELEDQCSYHEWSLDLQNQTTTAQCWTVFDGHQGWRCALYCAMCWPEIIEKHLRIVHRLSKMPEYIQAAVTDLDNQIKTDNIAGGSTFAACILIENHMWLVNLGDSRCVFAQQHNAELAPDILQKWGLELEETEMDQLRIKSPRRKSQVSDLFKALSPQSYLHSLNNINVSDNSKEEIFSILKAKEACDLMFTELLYSSMDHTAESDKGRIVNLVRGNKALVKNSSWTEKNIVWGRGKDALLMNTFTTGRAVGDWKVRTANKEKTPIKPLLSNICDVQYFDVAAYSGETFVMLGSHGLFRHLDPSLAFPHVDLFSAHKLNESSDSIGEAARRNGSTEDISLMLIPLRTFYSPG